MIAKRVRVNPCSVEYGMLEFDLVKAPNRLPATKYVYAIATVTPSDKTPADNTSTDKAIIRKH
jgi:hypothetical protein